MSEELVDLDLASIDQDPTQPRTEFNDEALARLARSLDADGLLQPITVRRADEGRFVVVSGERRLRAARSLGWPTIPSIIRELDDDAFRRLQLLENVVRENLNAVEYAKALKRMVDEGMSVADIAASVGEDPGNVTYYIALLGCRDEALHLLGIGQLGVTVARQIARLSHNNQLEALRRFQLQLYSTKEQVAICEALLAVEQRRDMFAEVDLTDDDRASVEAARRSICKARRSLARLRVLEESAPGSIGQTAGVKVPALAEEAADLAKEAAWLSNTLRRYVAATHVTAG